MYKNMFHPPIECQFPTLIADGYCHDFNNNRHCSFDGGDCCGPCVNRELCTECKCKTGYTNKITNAIVGNGFCNDETNIEVCNFDGGDCCGTCVNSKYCSECKCTGENSGIMNAFLGNGFCQDETNHGDCMFDGFDCCGYDTTNDGDYDDDYETEPGNKNFCSECLCKGNKSLRNNALFLKKITGRLQFILIDWINISISDIYLLDYPKKLNT